MTAITRCVHLHASGEQPSCLVPDPESKSSIQACMACAVDHAERCLRAGDQPTAIANDFSFRTCGHYREGRPLCRICYAGLFGALALAWSLHRAQSSPITSGIRAVINTVIKRYGVPLAGDAVTGTTERAA